MREEKRGKVTLETIESSEAEEKVVAYLGKLFGNVPPGWIRLLLKRTPAVLIDDIPAPEATDLIAKLNKLGAAASFSPQLDEDIVEESSWTGSPNPPSSNPVKTPLRRLGPYGIYGIIMLLMLLVSLFIFFVHTSK